MSYKKKGEICFLALSLTSVKVGAILEIAQGIKRQNSAHNITSWLGGTKAARMCFYPKGVGSNVGLQQL